MYINKVCREKIREPFGVKDVIECLGTSTAFLSKHAINPQNVNKKIGGKSYFIRVGRGF